MSLEKQLNSVEVTKAPMDNNSKMGLSPYNLISQLKLVLLK